MTYQYLKLHRGQISPPAGFSWIPTFKIFEVRPGVFNTDIVEKALRPSTTNTVYVDVNHPSASDANTGLDPALPKKSIWSALNRGLNDLIYVKAGLYTQNFSWFGITPLTSAVIVGVNDFTSLEPGQVISETDPGNINGILNINVTLHIENFTFKNGFGRSFFIQNGSVNFINCEFQSSQTVEAVGLSSAALGINHVVNLIRCRAINGFGDGFSLSSIAAGSTCKWLELGCTATLNGKAVGTHQGSTTHKIVGNGAISVLRINGVYYNNYGPSLIADVGGVESWNLGVTAHTINGGGTSTAFYCGDSGSMWLHSCQPYCNIDLQTDNAGGTIRVYRTNYQATSGPGTITTYTP
jgi:hypothetical protein